MGSPVPVVVLFGERRRPVDPRDDDGGVCGLLVHVSDAGDAPARQSAVGQALESLHHRGPDETGLVLAGSDVVFGHKRLSVIDVAGSHEPLPYPPDSGRYLLSFNGEIYNYIELRRELVDTFGAAFATDGDGEVLVAGYHYWGEAVVDKLRGMFAFVIWDSATREAFGARDPYGIKPLYHLRTGDGIYFASEKKALLPFASSAQRGDDGLDAASLSHYLTLQYVPEPRTMHEDISRLGSGECFTYAPGGPLQIRRYYRACFAPAPMADADRLAVRLREALRESVRLHMRSDVPVGAFLSSGIDSTAIVALAREFNPGILTFTVGYDMPGYCEIEVAQDSARHLEVTTIPTRIGPEDMMSALPAIVWHLDDPIADPSLVPLYFVARTAAQHVTVVLSGEGADEFFGGYAIYREPLSLAAITCLPTPLQRGLRAVSRAIPAGVRGKSYLERGTTPLAQRYYGNARIFTEADKARLLRRYDPDVRYTDVTAPLYAEVDGLDPVTTMQYIDLYTWLRGDILVKADRMTMAHSLEGRVPFLDRAVFEVAAQIPVPLKLPPRCTTTKYLLRRALDGIVPPGIVVRPKLGFPTPTRVWLKDAMYEWARDILSGSGADSLVDLSQALALLETHRRGEADKSREIWTVLVFCLWHAIFVEHSLDPGIGRGTPALRTKPVVGSTVS